MSSGADVELDVRAGLEVLAQHADLGAEQAVGGEQVALLLAAHVEDLEGVAVADGAVGELDEQRLAVGDDVDLEPRAGGEREGDDAGDGHDQRRVGDGARPDQPEPRLPPGGARQSGC